LYGSAGFPNRIETLVIASSEKTPSLGAVARPSGAGRSGDQPWALSFDIERLVLINAIEPTKPLPKAKVEKLDRSTSALDRDWRDELKSAFAAYAANNRAYRKNIDNPDFEADRVASMTSTVSLTNVLVHHVQMPLASRIELLQLSDAERAQRLLTIMRPAK
jgi:hypothetical protein